MVVFVCHVYIYMCVYVCKHGFGYTGVCDVMYICIYVYKLHAQRSSL